MHCDLPERDAHFSHNLSQVACATSIRPPVQYGGSVSCTSHDCQPKPHPTKACSQASVHRPPSRPAPYPSAPSATSPNLPAPRQQPTPPSQRPLEQLSPSLKPPWVHLPEQAGCAVGARMRLVCGSSCDGRVAVPHAGPCRPCACAGTGRGHAALAHPLQPAAAADAVVRGRPALGALQRRRRLRGHACGEVTHGAWRR
eukprot:357907-Chlamydomonas_euryale.AAC.2